MTNPSTQLQAWAWRGPPPDRLTHRQRVLAALFAGQDALLVVPQVDWDIVGPVCWRLHWPNRKRVTLQVWPVNEPLRPAYTQRFRADGLLAVEVYDYEGNRLASHTYDAAIKKDARDIGTSWVDRPDDYFIELKPFYPQHWHVFVLRDIADPARTAPKKKGKLWVPGGRAG